MGTVENISHNMTIEPNGFGQYNHKVVNYLLASVRSLMGNYAKDEKQCIILHRDDGPMCCSIGNYHIIFLHAHDNYWCQWVYQFAHEYCHHIIDGKMTGELGGLMWFEETLCELCSIYCIHHFVNWCENNPLPRQYAPSVREYLDQLTSGQLCADHLRDYISQNLDLLSSPDYQRGIYKRIAATILPSFVACPDLWRIIPLIGDSRQWLKLDELFQHFEAELSPTLPALSLLRQMVVG